MKQQQNKKKKLLLLSALTTISSLPVLSFLSCNVEKKEPVKENEELSNKKNEEKLKLDILSEEDKLKFTKKIEDSKTIDELNEISNEIQNKISEITEEFYKNLRTDIDEKISDIIKKNELTINSLSNKDNYSKLKEIEKEIKEYLQGLKSEIETKWISILSEQEQKTKKEELTSLTNEEKIIDFRTKLIATIDKENENTKYPEKKSEFTNKINSFKLEKRKTKWKEDLTKIKKYSETFDFEILLNEEYEKDLLEFKERNEILFSLFLDFLQNDSDKDIYKAKISNSSTGEEISKVIEQIKSSLTKTDEAVINKFKELVSTWIETIDKESIKKTLKTEKEKATTFEKLDLLLNKVIEEYQIELISVKNTVNSRLKTLNRYDSEKSKEFETESQKIAKDKKQLSVLAQNILIEFKKYKPYIELQKYSNEEESSKFPDKKEIKELFYYSAKKYPNGFFSISPRPSTKVTTSTEFKKGEYKVETYRTGKIKEYINSGLPVMDRTYTLTSEDKAIKNKIFELKSKILDEFYTLNSNFLGSKEYFLKTDISIGLKVKISRLLYTIDKALIDGYFYSEVYEALSGETLDGEVLKKSKDRKAELEKNIPADLSELKSEYEGTKKLNP
ncbi:hypothetical protein [Mycoplasma sp. 480]|uniref:hypothetical protein n=1 Tax=Mycoplasma sp. 480 TaxID=3440155 RepID=UPI003F5184F6